MLFEQTDLIFRQLQSFSEGAAQLCHDLAPYSDVVDCSDLHSFCQNFTAKRNDFFRKDRKFHLAVIGQVKAGKSSFLNTLLFDGKEILPRDSIPKTATLTRIEYAEENRLLVEYYTQEDWEQLRQTARLPSGRSAQSARETLEWMESHGPVSDYLSRRAEVLKFSSYGELSSRLNSYVGENGQITPFVKCVTLQVSLDCLRDISVVDTPGLNDPIRSRAEKTRTFMERCDAAFFLSRSSYFLDRNDLSLLTSQLPQKGIKRLILVASQFDSALMDTISDWSSLQEADLRTKAALRRHAAEQVDAAVLELRHRCSPLVVGVVEQCRKPVFVSAAAHDMSRKAPTAYTPQEALIHRCLGIHGELTAQDYLEIGNFSQVNDLFHQVAAQKDAVLQSKAETLAAVAQIDLLQLLERTSAPLQAALALGNGQRLPQLNLRSQETASRINRAQNQLGQIFSQYIAPLDSLFSGLLSTVRRLGQEYSEPIQKSSVEIHNKSKVVSDSKVLIPWTWGKQHTEYHSKERAYLYVEADGVLDNLYLLTENARQAYEAAFQPFLNTSSLQNRLFSVALSGEVLSADPEVLRAAVDQALGSIFLPRLHIEFPGVREELCRRFPAPARTPEEISELLTASHSCISQAADSICRQLEVCTNQFRLTVTQASDCFCRTVCQGLRQELEELALQRQTLEKEISRQQEALEVLHRYQ